MEFVDTHCHIQSAGQEVGEESTRQKWAKAGKNSPDDIFLAAQEAGVRRIVCVGCDLMDSELAINFAEKTRNAYASIGIHPHEAQNYRGNAASLQQFAALAKSPKVVAVGECGLDYYYEHSPRTDQIELLKFQLELALKHDLPMIFHVRGGSTADTGKDTFDDFWPIFDSYPGIRGVLHSFTDSAANLEKALTRGLYIGVNGIATFAKDLAQLEMYKQIPLSRLLLETDAPYLTPSPYRGTICEPYHIKVIAEFLSELRNEDLTDLAASTTNNARALLGIN